jgi:NADPH-dependent ferric siderophore reductase|tara:strand:+ start:6738 stop:7004 length:267 start_codon:yes stop_codon:yes gene_type:complete
MARTLLIGDEVAIPTAAGSATSFSQATVVRVVNVSGSSATVGVSTIVGAASTSFMTIPTGTVEYLEKRANEVIYATGTLRGAKVGFTG